MSRYGGTVTPLMQPTAEAREIVEILAAANFPPQEIAARIGVPTDVLGELFAPELMYGPARRNADVFLAAYRSAVEGSNAAQRLWLALAAPGVCRRPDDNEKPRPLSPAGKKVTLDLASRTAGQGTEWGDDLLLPGLVLVKGTMQ